MRVTYAAFCGSAKLAGTLPLYLIVTRGHGPFDIRRRATMNWRKHDEQQAQDLVPGSQHSVGYGLPCVRCKCYYFADLDACPVCQCRERISPDSGRENYLQAQDTDLFPAVQLATGAVTRLPSCKTSERRK